jgi:hypothetical protein
MRNEPWISPLHKKRYRVKCMKERSSPARAILEGMGHYVQNPDSIVPFPSQQFRKIREGRVHLFSICFMFDYISSDTGDT